MSQYVIRLGGDCVGVSCSDGEPILTAVLRDGNRSIGRGCRNGGCGVCRIRILRGKWRQLGPMSRWHVSEADQSNNIVLACKVAPLSNVDVQAMGLTRLAGSEGAVIRPEATR